MSATTGPSPPSTMRETVDLMLVPQEHWPRQSDDRVVVFLVPQSLKEIVEVVSLVQRKNVQRQTDELSVDVLIP